MRERPLLRREDTPSMDERTEDSRRKSDSYWLMFAVVCATLIKLFLAFKTEGTWDIGAFQDQLDKTREFGAAAYSLTGKFGNPLNILPVAIHLARASDLLTHVTGIPFAFWMRLP